MEFWTELGIEQTKDIEAITSAYHEKLKNVNPEDKPEEFMRLRAEYEAAMKYASGDEDTGSEPKGPVGDWMKRVDTVYWDFARRTDINEWKKLLADDVCAGLDSRIDARNALLEYMMDNYFLPLEVFRLLDSEFDLVESRKELYELFPRDFIDYAIVDNVKEELDIPVELFDRNADGQKADALIRLLKKVRGEVFGADKEAAEATFADIDKLGVYHPYTDLFKARLAYMLKDYDAALAGISALCEKYPDVADFHSLRGDVFRQTEKYEDAISEYEKAIETVKKHGQALYGKSECLVALGRYEDAKDVIYDLAEIYPDDPQFAGRIREINEKLLADYDERSKTETLDYDTSVKYAWCLYQNDRYDEAEKQLFSQKPESGLQKCEFENLASKLFASMGKTDLSYEHACEWEKAIKSLKDEGKVYDEQRNRLWRAIQIQAQCLLVSEKYSEALEAADRSIAADPTKTEPIEIRRRVFAVTHQLDKMVAEAERLAEVRPSFLSYYILGISQYEISLKQDAFNSFGKAIEYDKNAGAYIQRARILCDYEQYDDAEEITKLLKENEINDDNVKYIDARIAEGRGNTEEALKAYKDIISRYEADPENNGTGIMWETYYNALLLDQDNLSTGELIGLAEKGLKEKDDYLPLMYAYAFLLDRDGKKQEAIAEYKKMVEINPRHGSAYDKIGGIYFDDLDDFVNAAVYFDKQLEVTETARLYHFAGLSYLYQFNYDEAEKRYRRGLEIDPESVSLRSDLALLYEYKHEYEKSYEILKQLAEENDKAEEKSRSVLRNYSRVLSRLDRKNEAIEARLRNYSYFEDADDAVKVIELCVESGQADRAENFIKQFKSQGKLEERQIQDMTRDIMLLRRQTKKLVSWLKTLPDDSLLKNSSLATYYRRAGQYSKAVECYKKCDEIAGREEALANCRLYCYKWMGDAEGLKRETEQIQRNVDKLVNQKWTYALYLTKMALIRTATERPEEALPYIEQALAGPLCNNCKYSKCKDALVALAEYYYAKGEYSKAIEVCHEGIKIAADEYDFVAIEERIRKHHKKALKKEMKDSKK